MQVSSDSYPPRKHRPGLSRLPAELYAAMHCIIDEVGYIPVEQDAANLVFQLVSSRYEHASLILTSNLDRAHRTPQVCSAGSRDRRYA